MERTLTIYLAAVLVCGTSCTQTGLAPLEERWLNRMGGDGDESPLITEILANRERVEGKFIEAFRAGPPNALREAADEAAERVWSLAQVQLAEPETYNLDQADIAELKELSLEGEKRSAQALLDHNYRAAALHGLGITQGQAAKALLTQISTNQASPFRRLAGYELRFR